MKFMFIIGDYNLKDNGVAAYLKLLCQELVQRNHSVFVIPLFQKYTHEDLLDEFIVYAKESVINRFNKLNKIIDIIKPDIISIQFVPYSFQRKGLFWQLVLQSTLFNKLNVHIMVHEPWIEVCSRNKISRNLISYIQKNFFQLLLIFSKPILVTTSIEVFKKKIAYSVKLLPIYGNIRIQKFKPFLRKDGELKCLFFGSFTEVFDEFECQLKWLLDYCKYQSLKPVISIIGKIEISNEKHIKSIIKYFGFENIKILGWLYQEEISFIMQEQDIGISRASFDLIGKSGSTLAMLEHGMMVLLRGENKDLDFSISRYEPQIISVNSTFDISIKRFDPNFEAVEVHTDLFLSLIDESLLSGRR